jgi:hypothetical protein
MHQCKYKRLDVEAWVHSTMIVADRNDCDLPDCSALLPFEPGLGELDLALDAGETALPSVIAPSAANSPPESLSTLFPSRDCLGLDGPVLLEAAPLWPTPTCFCTLDKQPWNLRSKSGCAPNTVFILARTWSVVKLHQLKRSGLSERGARRGARAVRMHASCVRARGWRAEMEVLPRSYLPWL